MGLENSTKMIFTWPDLCYKKVHIKGFVAIMGLENSTKIIFTWPIAVKRLVCAARQTPSHSIGMAH